MFAQSRTRRFEQVVLPHLDAAYNLARWLTRDDQDAQDVVQDAYLRALKYFGEFRGDDARGWLLAIVRNSFYNWLKERAPQALTEAFDEQLHSGQDEAADAAGNDPAEALARGDNRRVFNQALEALPPEFREILVLRELEDLSYKEIAAIIDAPLGTVMSRLARARKRLWESVQQMFQEV
ncbi:MAG: sigma-70 family RNA polymerase sigma factor [Gammaproteobacteria bacterium]